MTKQLAVALLGIGTLLKATTVFGAGFSIIGPSYQFVARGLSSDNSTLVGDGLVLPLGTRTLGMTWTTSGGLVYMPNAGPDPYSIPLGISGDGSVIVGYNQNSANTRTAWRWSSSVGYQPIAPTNNVTSSFATGVSGDGQSVTGEILTNSSTNPFVWTATGGAITLPVAAGNAPIISSNGLTVAGNQATGGGVGFLWTAVGGMQTMNSLVNTNNVTPRVISSDGSQLFGVATSAIDNHWFIFHYASGTMTSLGAPSFYNDPTGGLDVVGATADGSEIVGMQSHFDPIGGTLNTTPWIWTTAGGFTPVQSSLMSAGIDLGAYQIQTVSGISNDGTMLFGQGLDHGIQASAWVAVVPEPSTMVGAVLTLVALVLRAHPVSKK